MKYTVVILSFALAFIGCSTEANNEVRHEENKETLFPEIDTVVKIESSVIENNTLPIDSIPEKTENTTNFTDSQGLKQGIWKHFLNKKIWKIDNYKGGKLNGECFEYLADGEFRKTKYKNGKRHGYSSLSYPDLAFARVITYWENGEKTWTAFPEELATHIQIHKGVLTKLDSVEIIVPYNSGKLLYQGTVRSGVKTRSKPSGIHKVYFETGELKSLINYDSLRAKSFDKSGGLIKEEDVRAW